MGYRERCKWSWDWRVVCSYEVEADVLRMKLRNKVV